MTKYRGLKNKVTKSKQKVKGVPSKFSAPFSKVGFFSEQVMCAPLQFGEFDIMEILKSRISKSVRKCKHVD